MFRWRSQQNNDIRSECWWRFCRLPHFIRHVFRYKTHNFFSNYSKIFDAFVRFSGLFQQAISMSGSPLNFYWGLQTKNEAEVFAEQLVSNLRLQPEVVQKIESQRILDDKEKLLAYLNSATAEEIIDATSKLPSFVIFILWLVILFCFEFTFGAYRSEHTFTFTYFFEKKKIQNFRISEILIDMLTM